MFELQLIVLGIVQGVTEFLPISSSAHLIIVSDIFNWEDQGINHDIAVHVGTLGAVIIYLRKDILSLFKDFFITIIKRKSTQKFLYLKIIVSCLPAVIVGFFIYNYFLKYFRDIHLIAYSCIFFGVLLYLSDKYNSSKKIWTELTFSNAFIIGICQCFAFVPGASRAGVTIMGARLLGFSRESAAVYSMLLSIPIILGSFILALPNFLEESLNTYNLIQILVSSLISFITAFLSIKFMIKLVRKSNYNLFVVYRILLGIVILIWIYI